MQTKPTIWFRTPDGVAYLGRPSVHEAQSNAPIRLTPTSIESLRPVRPSLSPAERLRIALLMLLLLAVPAVGVWEWWKGSARIRCAPPSACGERFDRGARGTDG